MGTAQHGDRVQHGNHGSRVQHEQGEERIMEGNCRTCGQPVTASDAFCGNCGEPAVPVTELAAPVSRETAPVSQGTAPGMQADGPQADSMLDAGPWRPGAETIVPGNPWPAR